MCSHKEFLSSVRQTLLEELCAHIWSFCHQSDKQKQTFLEELCAHTRSFCHQSDKHFWKSCVLTQGVFVISQTNRNKHCWKTCVLIQSSKVNTHTHTGTQYIYVRVRIYIHRVVFLIRLFVLCVDNLVTDAFGLLSSFNIFRLTPFYHRSYYEYCLQVCHNIMASLCV